MATSGHTGAHTASSERGQALAEYAVILGAVSIVAVAVLLVFGNRIVDMYTQVSVVFP